MTSKEARKLFETSIYNDIKDRADVGCTKMYFHHVSLEYLSFLKADGYVLEVITPKKNLFDVFNRKNTSTVVKVSW